jgi:hypothetical protein
LYAREHEKKRLKHIDAPEKIKQIWYYFYELIFNFIYLAKKSANAQKS